MPLYLDVHDRVCEQPSEALLGSHQHGLDIQYKHGAKYLKSWYDDRTGTVQFLLAAPTLETARTVHCEAHGDSTVQIVELDESALWRRTPRTTMAVRPSATA